MQPAGRSRVTVVLAAFALVGWFRKKWYYRRVIVIPASLLIAATGLYWSIQRAVLTS